MFKRFVIIVGIVAAFFVVNIAGAQDTNLRVLTLDYLGETIQPDALGLPVELTVVTQPEFESFVAGGQLGEFDLILVDNQVIDPFLPELGEGFFIPLCERNPDLCWPPVPSIPDLCALRPWLPMCGNPCPSPISLSCVPVIAWDIPIIIDPWDPMPWTLDMLIETVNVETVMVDPRNGVGFYLTPAVFEMARPNLTINLDDAFLVFTPACNYIAHYEEFTEKGFLPIAVEGYQETPFNIGAYVPASGNVDLATEITGQLLNNTDFQMSIFRSTGLLPGNIEVLNEILPG